jgi:hypothetical protein
MQSEPKNEARPSDWELEYLRTFPGGGGLMLEKRNTSSTSEEHRLRVQCDLGNGLGLRPVFQHTWSHTSLDIQELLTCSSKAFPSGKPQTPSE